MGFTDKVLAAGRSNNSLLCVGLDPDWETLAPELREEGPRFALYESCARIIEETKDLVCAYKPNAAFFEAHGSSGVRALEDLCRYIPGNVPIILDVKRGDIGNTARAYARACFDSLGADAVTVAPYMGWDSVEPFATRKGKGVFVLCRTSNPSAKDFQDLKVDDRPLFEHVATQVAAWRAQHGGELGVVAGATYPEELGRVRTLVGEDMPILIPGVGTQGGSPRDAVTLGGNRRGELAIVNVGRAVANAPKPRAAAAKLRDELNAFRPR